MRITVLTVPDCPNGPLVRARLAEALAGPEAEVAAEIEQIEVTELAQAERLGMTGSPTVLVDGTDPFATPGAEPSVSCRLYRAADGSVGGAPTVTELRAALTR
ncbi:alkylmercury lyase [Streptacidiphilus pinicola]|uniref:Alkylmercury lyase n=1 Tax=Streptacidiphilus pinicola TaxID=2219663 RepID=A0A2X0I9G2_9ACTN|nr:alkylmercury lyase [Streptacidiphilus pinicola]RAG81582.1 alkylmercury lyase [Streptacidiphilus pinicola]